MMTILFDRSMINLIVPGTIVFILTFMCLFNNKFNTSFEDSELGRSIASNDFRLSSSVYLTSSIPLVIDTVLDSFNPFPSVKAKWLWFGRLVLSFTCLFAGLQFQFISTPIGCLVNCSLTNPALKFSLTLYGLRSIVTGSLMFCLSALNPKVFPLKLTSSVTVVVSLTMLIRFLTTGSHGMYCMRLYICMYVSIFVCMCV